MIIFISCVFSAFYYMYYFGNIIKNNCVMAFYRSCITTKCTDEAKLYRNRQQYKQNNESRENQENKIPPSPSSNETAIMKK